MECCRSVCPQQDTPLTLLCDQECGVPLWQTVMRTLLSEENKKGKEINYYAHVILLQPKLGYSVKKLGQA